MKPILISEIFGPVLQGEGALIGRPTVFVRTAGCDYRCAWCDSLYAVLPEYKAEWTAMSPDRVLEQVKSLTNDQPILVTLSGGNPALQPMDSLIESGQSTGFSFCMETQGSVCKDWFSKLEYLVLSPKPPSSKMETDWDILAQCVASGAKSLSLKVVVFDDVDYDFAREVHRRFPAVPFYLQAGSDLAASEIEYSKATAERLNELMARALGDGWRDVTILPQLHVLLWGQKRGV
jgi:7-carboxy-7-deazaguanine synthase